MERFFAMGVYDRCMYFDSEIGCSNSPMTSVPPFWPTSIAFNLHRPSRSGAPCKSADASMGFIWAVFAFRVIAIIKTLYVLFASLIILILFLSHEHVLDFCLAQQQINARESLDGRGKRRWKCH